MKVWHETRDMNQTAPRSSNMWFVRFQPSLRSFSCFGQSPRMASPWDWRRNGAGFPFTDRVHTPGCNVRAFFFSFLDYTCKLIHWMMFGGAGEQSVNSKQVNSIYLSLSPFLSIYLLHSPSCSLSPSHSLSICVSLSVSLSLSIYRSLSICLSLSIYLPLSPSRSLFPSLSLSPSIYEWQVLENFPLLSYRVSLTLIFFNINEKFL